MKVSDAVAQVRSLTTGALLDEVSVLAQPYDPLVDTSITLKYAKRSLAPGSVLSVGLNTCQAMVVSGDGTSIEVLPNMDGGPAVAVPKGAIVHVRPQFTTWAIYREMQNEIQGISSRQVGLYRVLELEYTALNRQSGTYEVPPQPDGKEPFRLLKFEYRYAGTTTWQTSTDAEYQRYNNTLRVFQDPPGAIEYRFSLAMAFGDLVDLDQDLAEVGINDTLANIITLGAAATMAMGWEGRRTQPFSQGDSRRAAEVGVGGSASLSRNFRALQQDNINEEVARLIALYGFRQPAISGQTSYGRYGTYGGWR